MNSTMATPELVEAYENGQSFWQLAQQFGIPVSYPFTVKG